MELRRKSENKRSARARDKFSALRDLRNKNITASEYLKDKEDNVRIYDEVDEQEYQDHQRLQEEDDFVVEDEVGGYTNSLQENDYDNFSSDSDTGNKKSKKKKPDKNQFMESLFQDLGKSPAAANKRKASTHSAQKPKPKDRKNKRTSINPRIPDESDIKRIKMEYDVVSAQPLPEISALSYQQSSTDNIETYNYNLDNDDFDFNDIDDDIHIKTEDVPDNDINIPKEPEEQFDDLLVDDQEHLLDWMSLQGGMTLDDNVPDLNLNSTFGTIEDASSPSLKKNDSFDTAGSESFDMFWLDAFENNGTVYLFGKTPIKSSNQYLSTCIAVNGIERNLFVLPRIVPSGESTAPDERYDISQVHGEIQQLLLRNGINEFASKPVSRKYSFEDPAVPKTAEYLKIVYDFKSPRIPLDTTGRTFQKVFGSTYSALELLLLKRKIMGPCWLKIFNTANVSPKLSWCRKELAISSPKNICVMADDERTSKNYPSVPPLSVASISAKTIINKDKNTNEIVSISLLTAQKYDLESTKPLSGVDYSLTTIIRQLDGVPFPFDFERLATHNSPKAKEARGGQNIFVVKSERELLLFLIGLLARSDPDFIVGHNFLGFLLDVLLHRMKLAKVEDWSKLGRMKRTVFPKLQAGLAGMGDSTYEEKSIMAGRIVCDSYLTSKELVRAKSYSLSSLAQSELQIKRDDFSLESVIEAYNNTRSPTPLLVMCRHTSFDAYLCMALVHRLQTLPLTRQLTNLAGNLWSRTMSGARAERNEFLLLHEFYGLKFIRPDKLPYNSGKNSVPQKGSQKNNPLDNSNNMEAESLNNNAYDSGDSDNEIGKSAISSSAGGKAGGRRKPAYLGGLVLEPKKGLYEQYVLLMDFNSLYPSIIQEFNICFTTTERSGDENETLQDPDPSLPIGLLPKLLRNLVDKRRQVKNLLKKPNLSDTQKNVYDVRQKALKLTANSMYGCLGYKESRFCAKPLAALITSKGRQILLDTQALSEQQGLEVLYGDTDSIMINTASNDLKNAYEVGAKFKKQVNDLYKQLELDIDGVFRRLLLLRKKKYAALLVTESLDKHLAKKAKSMNGSDMDIDSVETKLETRGLDIVRRDWCELSHEISGFILNKLLSGQDSDLISTTIYNHLETVGRFVRSGKAPLDKFVINKGLSKSPDAYSDSQTLPHVTVAKRMKKSGYSIKSGDTVPYVIGVKTDAGSNPLDKNNGPSDSSSLLSERGFHIDEVKSSNGKIIIGINSL
ncbi:DNA polymerase alpha catalytic subunit [Smittium culicis]|uniref:DNA polymerase n=1 Tax=Smittium culicis TaxID=133412 RepID=A0A1R1YR06_9FUNG|nr:DNA polymerase alpha catalytic subunit [Smittium culicis]